MVDYNDKRLSFLWLTLTVLVAPVISGNCSVSSSSSLHNASTSGCALISIHSKNFTLTGVVTFDQSTSITIVGDPSVTNVTCNANSGFKFTHCLNIHLENLRLTNCFVNETFDHFLVDYPFLDTAALYIFNSSNLEISNCGFMSNPSSGVLLYEVTGRVFIKSCHFYANFNNSSTSTNGTCGGLVIMREHIQGKANYTIDSCTFESNSNTKEGLGGGVTVRLGVNSDNTSVTVLNSTFNSNKAYSGAGLFLNHHTSNRSSDIVDVLNVSSTTFSSNTAHGKGGGLYYISKCASVSLLLYFYNCAFDSNLAEWGGGIASYVARRGKLSMTAGLIALMLLIL